LNSPLINKLLAGLILAMFFAPFFTSAANLMDASRPEFAQSRFPLVAVAVAEIPDSQSLTVEKLAEQLSAIANDDEEKAFAIFRWITTHIRYDVEKLRAGSGRNLTAPEVMELRQAVCGGYAALYQALASAMKLQSFTVTGQAKGYGTGTMGHAWTAVKTGPRWVLIDATWGSGYLDEQQQFVRQYNDYYFMVPPAELIYSHFPDEPNWQLLEKPVSRVDFKQSAHLYSSFFELGLGLQAIAFSPDGSRLTLQFSNPRQAKFSARILSDGREVKGNWYLPGSNGENSTLEIKFPAAGDYGLEVFGQSAKKNKTYHTRHSAPLKACFLFMEIGRNNTIKMMLNY